MSDQKSSSGRFPRRTPGRWPGREAGAARRRKRLDSGQGRWTVCPKITRPGLDPGPRVASGSSSVGRCALSWRRSRVEPGTGFRFPTIVPGTSFGFASAPVFAKSVPCLASCPCPRPSACLPGGGRRRCFISWRRRCRSVSRPGRRF